MQIFKWMPLKSEAELQIATDDAKLLDDNDNSSSATTTSSDTIDKLPHQHQPADDPFTNSENERPSTAQRVKFKSPSETTCLSSLRRSSQVASVSSINSSPTYSASPTSNSAANFPSETKQSLRLESLPQLFHTTQAETMDELNVAKLVTEQLIDSVSSLDEPATNKQQNCITNKQITSKRDNPIADVPHNTAADGHTPAKLRRLF